MPITRRIPKSYKKIMENLEKRIRRMRPRLSPIEEYAFENNSNNENNNSVGNSNNNIGHNEEQLKIAMAAPAAGPVKLRNMATPVPMMLAPQAIRPVAAPGGGISAFKSSFGSAFKKPGTSGGRRRSRTKKLTRRRRR